MQVYSSTVVPCVRARCLGIIARLLAAGSPKQLQVVLADLPISSFVAGLLTSRELKAQAAAMQMAEILMAKLPNVFAGFFVREGVAHALEQLAVTAGEEAGPSGGGAGTATAASGLRSTLFAAAFERRASGCGSGLPPPSPPVTRSRRSSRADQVSACARACLQCACVCMYWLCYSFKRGQLANAHQLRAHHVVHLLRTHIQGLQSS